MNDGVWQSHKFVSLLRGLINQISNKNVIYDGIKEIVIIKCLQPTHGGLMLFVEEHPKRLNFL